MMQGYLTVCCWCICFSLLLEKSHAFSVIPSTVAAARGMVRRSPHDPSRSSNINTFSIPSGSRVTALAQMSDKDMQAQMSEMDKQAAEEWKEGGRRDMVLKRKKDFPRPELPPGEAANIIVRALQINDDPILDYGAAVCIKFASSDNDILKLSPTQYGNYLRGSEFAILVENSRVERLGEAQVSEDGTRALQRFRVRAGGPDPQQEIVDLQLSKGKPDDSWRLDAITMET